jgi:hypothetical protein
LFLFFVFIFYFNSEAGKRGFSSNAKVPLTSEYKNKKQKKKKTARNRGSDEWLYLSH